MIRWMQSGGNNKLWTPTLAPQFTFSPRHINQANNNKRYIIMCELRSKYITIDDFAEFQELEENNKRLHK